MTLPLSPADAGGISDGADSAGPLDVAGARLLQSHRSLIFRLHTRGEWRPGALARHPTPGDPNERFACLIIHKVSAARKVQLCFGKPGTGKHSRLGFSILKSGEPRHRKLIDARVVSLGAGRFEAAFRPQGAGLDPGRYRWRSVSQWSGPQCLPDPPLPCKDRAPDGRDARFRLLPVQPVRCRASGPNPVFHGSRRRKEVALTFDDGPSDYTPEILSVLRRKNARGTFFELGDQLAGREHIARSLVKSGQELANHSLRHEYKPSYASMASTSRRIEAATGFRPCLFRPPYGAYDSRVVGDAASLGMTTANWDVDPMDWTTPGSDAIYQRVVSNAQPGSIVLLHDGGGNRSQTVAALPRIIENLRDRGYRFSTLSALLGQRTIWEPVARSTVVRQRSISRPLLPPRPGEFVPPQEFRVAENPHGLGRE